MKTDLPTLRRIFGYPKGNYSIERPEDFETIIIKHTSQDLTPRTMKGHNKQLLIDPVYKPLAKTLYEYIHNNSQLTEATFDTWHKEVCENFQKDFDAACKLATPLPFGKAQKIVNMTFKNLLCCAGSEQYLDRFIYCHMPLDSYTLDGWFKSDVLDWYNSQNPKDKQRKRGEIPSWSNLGQPMYTWIQKQIRGYLMQPKHIYHDDSGKPLTALQAEFYIWSEQKWFRATRDLPEQDILQKTFPLYPNKKLAQMAQQFADMAERLKNF